MVQKKVFFLFALIRSGLGVFASRLFGLVRDILVAGVYGANHITDIFFVAFAIPNLFRQFFAEGAMSSAYVPFLSDKTARQGSDKANSYLSQLILVQTVIISILCLFLILFAPIVIKIFMPGYANNIESVALGASLLRIVMFYLLSVSISGLLAGYLNLHNSYFISYASTASLNIAMIAGAIVGYYDNANIYCLAVSVLAGGAIQVVLLYIFARAKGFKFKRATPLDPDIKKTYSLLIPSLAGAGVSQLNFLVGRAIASFLQAGSISWLFYANRLFQFPLGVFSITISTVSLTELSKARTTGDEEAFNAIIDKAMFALLLMIIPSTIGLMMLSTEIIDLIFSRKAFTAKDTIMTAQALNMYAVGLMFYSLASVLTRVFHSMKDTKTPVKIAIVAFIINFILNLLFMKPLQHMGIALASSIAALVNASLLYYSLKGYSFSLNKNKVLLIKLIVANLILTAIILAGKHYGIHVLIIISICVTSYFLALIAMKVNIIRMFR